MRGLVEKLNQAGWAVQLKHTEKETTWEEHGFVKLTDPSTGTVLAESEHFQHNRHFRDMSAAAEGLAAKVGKPQERVAKATAQDSDEVSTKASDEGAD